MNDNYIPMDPLTYNNCVLTHNIAYLSSISFQQFYQMKEENENLKKQNSELQTEITSLKRKLSDCEWFLKKEKEKNSQSESKAAKTVSRFNYVYFRPEHYSWDYDKVNQVISSIKNIDDIIKLDKQWFSIRHNATLQKLYYLIPALTKLKNMVGLGDIKKDIFKKIIYYIQNPHSDEYLHTIISGPPGVGKTEFAKIYANIFVRLGILKSDNFIEIKRDDLVGEYLGQTAPRTRKLLESAMNGVVFLDEAYSLGNREKRDSFSKEAIDMLNQYLSERKGQFMFIVAGYEDDLESCLFGYNKGMRRRFHYHYKIKGYEPNEMGEIFSRKVSLAGYTLAPSQRDITEFFSKNKAQFEYYGGDIEKLVNEIKQVQSLRTFSQNIRNREIIMDDINHALKNLEDKQTDTYGPPSHMYV